MIRDIVVPRKFGLVAGGIVSLGLFIGGSSAMAQQPAPPAPPAESAQPPEEVTVTAPRVVHQTVGRSNIGAPIEVTSISREVKFEDLNLSTESGEAAVKERIRDAARGMCKELDKMYPLDQPDRNCVSKAVSSAMNQVDKMKGVYGTRQ